MASGDSVKRWVRTNPNQLFALGLAVLIIGLSAWTGLRSRSVAESLSFRRRSWEGMAGQVATVQQQFRMPTTTESAALRTEASRLSALGVIPGEQVSLVETVGTLAEACLLESVRVTAIAKSDSAYMVDREVTGSHIKPATYALAVEFAGSFANAQMFVSRLPTSVSLSRLKAARRDGVTRYYLVLSVYELDAKSGD